MRKYILLLTVLSVFTASYAQKRDKVVLRPETESNSTGNMLEIARIELADTATVFYFDAYQRPNYWFKIASASSLTDKSGKSYKLTACKGITLDKEEYAPESGHVAFVLTFEPVDKGVKTVDFKKNDEPEAFRINGIKLYNVSQPDRAIRCVLKGEVLNRPYSSRLILSKINEDVRTAKVVYIPITDGKFEHVINGDCEEMYELRFYDEHLQGAWRPIKFFCESDTIRFTLYTSDEYEKNSIEGGKLNGEYLAFEKNMRNKLDPIHKIFSSKIDSLDKSGKYYSAEATKIMKKLNQAVGSEKDKLFKELNKLHDEGKDKTSEAKRLNTEGDSISRTVESMRMDYVEQNPGMAGYAILADLMFWQTKTMHYDGVQRSIKIFNTVYAPKYPNHPYTSKIRDLIAGTSVKVGNRYIDVTAVDAGGNPVKLSEHIDGKVALIYLWASWCGPCRKKGKEIIPVYETYKDKGFTVVGIAREKSVADMIRAVKQDGYPWLSLSEINDKENIWNKYGIGNAGGGEFLVDRNGVILVVNPTAKEVEKILEKQ
jgi:thiol-disulfide isomerase/thioredoxin